MKQHKWHKEIKAWADGAEIEKWMLNDTWQRVGHPDWYEFENYRIKSQPKEPQPKDPQYLYVSQGDDGKPDLSFVDHVGCVGKIKLESDDEQ